MKLGVSITALIRCSPKTEADCFEPLSQFWDSGRDENKQAKEVRDLMTEHNFETSCYTLDSNFAVCDETADRTCIECCIENVLTQPSCSHIHYPPRSKIFASRPT